MIKAIINVNIFDFENYRENAFVLFDDHILTVGDMKDYEDKDYQTFDAKNQWLMPGLIAGHTHIYSTFARGLSLPFSPENFQEILDQLWWKIDRHIDKNVLHASGIVSAVDFVRNGITTIIDHHASGMDIDGSLETLKTAVCDTVGLRGIFAFETSDRFNKALAINENQSFAKRYHTNQVRGLFGLHASMSLSEETLKDVKKVLNHTPIHIHVAESKMDQEDALNRYQERVVERLYRHGLVQKDSIMTHAIHVNEHELDIIKQQGAVISVNVSSNMNNGVGLPDIKTFLKKEIPVIIGNDGLSSGMANEYLTLVYAMHHREKTPVGFGLDELKTIIQTTYDYASRLLEVQLGRIEKGYAADFLLIPYTAPTPIDKSNAMAHFFYGLLHSFKPSHVFASGKHIVNNYKVPKLIQQKYRLAQLQSRILWKRIQKERAQ